MRSQTAVRLGAQQPRVRYIPQAGTSAGQEAVDLAEACGLVLDEWQRDVLEWALRERDGKWAALEVALVVPRQNGKGSILEALELAALFSFGCRLVLHSAHQFTTCKDAFDRLWSLIQANPEFSGRVDKVYQSNQATEIIMKDRSKIKFLARHKGGGRGFSGDLVVLDEAYALTDDHMAALLPTLSAKAVTGNPQLWYTSSAPLEDSTVLHSLRRRGRAGDPNKDPRLAYMEWSAPDGCDPDDRDMWALANPGFGVRLSEDFTETERGGMSQEAFLRERLGIAPDILAEGNVIDPEAWAGCLVKDTARIADPVCLAVDVTPDRSAASIAAAGSFGDRMLVDLVDHREGVRWVVARIIELRGRHRVKTVIIDPRGPVGSLLPELDAAKVPVKLVNTGQYGSACGAFFDAVTQTKLAHIGQWELDEAVAAARKKPMGDAWKWDRSGAFVDISPLIASTLALWGHASEPKSKPRVISMADYWDQV